MCREISLQYLVDRDTFELKPKTNDQPKLLRSLAVSLTLPYVVNSFEESKVVRFSVDFEGLEARISSAGGEIISIEASNTLDWQRFLDENLTQFVGLIAAILLSGGKEEFLWVERNHDGRIWILCVVWNERFWQGMLLNRPRRKDLDRTFWRIRPGKNCNEKKLIARRLFNSLTDKKGLGLPIGFPLFLDEESRNRPKACQLIIKLNPSELWFLLFPLDYFCQLNEYGRFSFYDGVEWLLTGHKSFVQNMYERQQIQNELKNVTTFLKHSVIILNTYYSFEREPSIRNQWRTGTDLLKEIFPLFQDIEIEGETLSLRWYLNPLMDEVFSELLNSDTWYFFADFHTENGVWQTGGCERLSWKNNSPNPNETATEYLTSRDLSHIRLMRVFHCASVIDFDQISVRPSIVSSLLNMGALRIEGSVAEGNYLDHCCSLLYLACDSKGLRPYLIAKCWEKGKDYKKLINRVNRFLKSNGWQSISS